MYGQKAKLLFCNNSNNSIESPRKLLSTEFKPETLENDDLENSWVLWWFFFRMMNERWFLGTQKVSVIYFYLYRTDWLVNCAAK